MSFSLRRGRWAVGSLFMFSTSALVYNTNTFISGIGRMRECRALAPSGAVLRALRTEPSITRALSRRATPVRRPATPDVRPVGLLSAGRWAPPSPVRRPPSSLRWS